MRPRKLDITSDEFPEEYSSAKILPELLKSVEFGGGGPRVFATVMKIGSKLSDEDYISKLAPVIVRLFSNPDRAIRVCLLDNLPSMIGHLPQKTVNDKIFPQMVRSRNTVHADVVLTEVGHWICRRFATCSRTDFKGGPYSYNQAFRPYNQW